MLLGAAHGATQWESIDDFVLEEGELRCEIPYAGVFCGFTRCATYYLLLTTYYLLESSAALLGVCSSCT